MYRIISTLTLLSVLVTTALTGQVQIRSTIGGVVLDESGGAVPDGRVTATHADVGYGRTAVTGADGYFRFASLQPGEYHLTVAKDGFAAAEVQNVRAAVGETVDLRIVLPVATVEDSITVQAEVELQTQSPEISAVVDERRMESLPLNGKDFQKLIQLAPGVGGVPPSSSSFSPTIAGGRSLANNYTIDGVTANDERVDGLTPGAGFSNPGNAVPAVVSTEAIAEFRVITSNADASFGLGSGGQINIVTKSGTNDLHGSVYEYLRNDAMDARDFFDYGPFFDDQGRSVPPPFKQNLYGASLGGPLAKDKHFFFGSYEGFRQRRERTSSLSVPNGDLIGLIPGDLGRLYRAFYIDQGLVPASGNPAGDFRPLGQGDREAATAAGFNPALFDADLGNGEAGTAVIGATIKANIDREAVLVRTDHQLSRKLSASFRYSFYDFEQLGGRLGDLIREPRRWHGATAQFVYTFSPSQLGDLRLSVNRGANRSIGVAGESPALESVGVTPDQGIFVSPADTDLRFIRVRSATFSLNNQTVPQVAYVHSVHRNRLSLRAGIEAREVRLNFSSNNDIPFYTFRGFTGPNGLLGAGPGQTQAVAESASQTVFGRNGGPTTPLRGYSSMQVESFVQTDWRLNPSLTVNLGLRYSIFGVYDERHDAISNLYAVDSQGSIVPDASPRAFGRTSNELALIGDDRPFYQSDHDNLAPRVGIAWTPGASRGTVLRAGYGIYFDRLRVLEFSDVAGNEPLATGTTVENFEFALGRTIPIDPQTAGAVGVDPTIRNPYTQRFNVGVEQGVGADTSVSISYVGARGRGLYRFGHFNGGFGVAQDLRPDPRFSTVRIQNSSASSNYDSLQAFLRRRMAKGVDLTVSYTYAQSKDNVSRAFSFNATPALINLGGSVEPGFQGGGDAWVDRPLAADWGFSEFDLRHVFVTSHVWELPFGRGRRFVSNAGKLANAVVGGWSWSGLLAVRSGSPFNVTLGQDIDDDGISSDRPMLASGGSLESVYAGGGDKTQFLVPAGAARDVLVTPTNVLDPFQGIERNFYHGPATWSYDVSLAKQFAFSDRVSLGAEVNVFNLFNHTNLGNPNSNLQSSFFGTISRTVGLLNPRQVQLGLKLRF